MAKSFIGTLFSLIFQYTLMMKVNRNGWLSGMAGRLGKWDGWKAGAMGYLTG